MVVTAVVSNVVRMVGTQAALSLKTATMKVQCCVSRSMFSRQAANFPHHFLLSIGIDQLDKTDAPLIPEAYINLLGMEYSFFNGLTGYTVPLQHLRSPKTTHRLKPSPTEPGQAGPQTLLKTLNALAAPLLPPYHEPLQLHFR
jgi:hypothetical protein